MQIYFSRNTRFLYKGFTLAEVLITLGIIGVVAAMTLPSLVSKYKAVELETRFKKAYSALNQACIRMVFEEGYVIQKTSTVDASPFRNMLQKYIAKSTDCSDYKCGGPYFNSRATFISWAMNTYQTYTGGSGNSLWWFIDDGLIRTRDGMLLYIDISEYESFLVTVDINGFNAPNKWGHDLFTFMFDTNTGKLTFPKNTKWDESEDPEMYGVVCDRNSSSGLNGLLCAQKALSEKDYFKNLP